MQVVLAEPTPAEVNGEAIPVGEQNREAARLGLKPLRGDDLAEVEPLVEAEFALGGVSELDGESIDELVNWVDDACKGREVDSRDRLGENSERNEKIGTHLDAHGDLSKVCCLSLDSALSKGGEECSAYVEELAGSIVVVGDERE